jgi:hypothetical protein
MSLQRLLFRVELVECARVVRRVAPYLGDLALTEVVHIHMPLADRPLTVLGRDRTEEDAVLLGGEDVVQPHARRASCPLGGYGTRITRPNACLLSM